jgi:hypothetical protein
MVTWLRFEVGTSRKQASKYTATPTRFSETLWEVIMTGPALRIAAIIVGSYYIQNFVSNHKLFCSSKVKAKFPCA